jgi:hypothetical protein
VVLSFAQCRCFGSLRPGDSAAQLNSMLDGPKFLVDRRALCYLCTIFEFWKAVSPYDLMEVR